MPSITDLEHGYTPRLWNSAKGERFLTLNQPVLDCLQGGYFTPSEQAFIITVLTLSFAEQKYTIGEVEGYIAHLCFASNATIAKRCNISQRQAHTIRNQLIAKQVIVQLPPDEWHYEHNPKPYDFLRGKLGLPAWTNAINWENWRSFFRKSSHYYRTDTILLAPLDVDWWQSKPLYEPCPPPIKKQL